jgi:hypothetical protein
MEQRRADALRIRHEQILRQYEQQKRLLEVLEEEYEQAIARLQQEDVESDSESNYDYAPTEITESADPPHHDANSRSGSSSSR